MYNISLLLHRGRSSLVVETLVSGKQKKNVLYPAKQFFLSIRDKISLANLQNGDSV